MDSAELEPFRCEVEPDRSAVRVRPIGELDLATVTVVEAELGELWAVGFTDIVVDLREVRFLDSTGVRLLWSWHTHSSADGFAFEVIPGPPVVQRVLELAGVADRLTFRSRDGSGPRRGLARGLTATLRASCRAIRPAKQCPRS